MNAEGDMLYVYAIVAGDDYAPAVTGIDGSALHMVGRDTGPRAVVHRHTRGPFDGPDDSVRRWVLEHSEVIDDAWQNSPALLPVSFNVIVRSDPETEATATQQLEHWLDDSAVMLSRRLEELCDTSELRVEIFLDGGLLEEVDAEVGEMRTETESRPAGVRRLLEKRLEKTEKEIVDRAADRIYPEIRARIAAHCLDIEEHRSTSRESGLTPVIMASCLVKSTDATALGAELTALKKAQPALSIRFLGPWPPYSFADVSISEERNPSSSAPDSPTPNPQGETT
ncbi:GvpL/GvpF family gas vesicle protein [Brevibacterium spongiae]|uniref:GvpL/GvpF family gas vesicle protein n=1 Tax=Brevibacterium spongiae TaxID=2909672 RepID=A0ABY5SLD3_9MICO|nr:GvpL/GvpF family gas vesicle protein [Brevibacterium spongiae]UVI35337.1 GvpL/GvpF family gas vesicle protein [Brevibacterium spongiae]